MSGELVSFIQEKLNDGFNDFRVMTRQEITGGIFIRFQSTSGIDEPVEFQLSDELITYDAGHLMTENDSTE